MMKSWKTIGRSVDESLQKFVWHPHVVTFLVVMQPWVWVDRHWRVIRVGVTFLSTLFSQASKAVQLPIPVWPNGSLQFAFVSDVQFQQWTAACDCVTNSDVTIRATNNRSEFMLAWWTNLCLWIKRKLTAWEKTVYLTVYI